MAETDVFELRVADTLLWYADDVSTAVDAAAVAHRAVLEHPRPRTRTRPWAFRPTPAFALLVLAALVIAALAAALFVGSQRAPRLPAVVPLAACPTGASPDEPGRMDPAGSVVPWSVAFDRHAGMLLAVGGPAPDMSARTWALDVCTNLWTELHLDRDPEGIGRLVYDTDSDVTINFEVEGPTWALDLDANTWTEGATAPVALRSFAYDPVSGLVVAAGDLDEAETPRSELWSYDVETDTWAFVTRGPSPYLGIAYDASVDRIVAYARGATWLFDMRTGTWVPSAARAPRALGPLGGPGTIAYDEAAARTVVFGHGYDEERVLIAYDAASDRWETLVDGTDPNLPDEMATMTYDPMNERLVGVPYFEPVYDGDPLDLRVELIAFETATRTWTTLSTAPR